MLGPGSTLSCEGPPTRMETDPGEATQFSLRLGTKTYRDDTCQRQVLSSEVRKHQGSGWCHSGPQARDGSLQSEEAGPDAPAEAEREAACEVSEGIAGASSSRSRSPGTRRILKLWPSSP